MLLKGYEVSEQETELFGNAWSDFQQEFDSHLGFERQLSLKMAPDMAGVDFSGREHDALDDARNTAEVQSKNHSLSQSPYKEIVPKRNKWLADMQRQREENERARINAFLNRRPVRRGSRFKSNSLKK